MGLQEIARAARAVQHDAQLVQATRKRFEPPFVADTDQCMAHFPRHGLCHGFPFDDSAPSPWFPSPWDQVPVSLWFITKQAPVKVTQA
jgi:hypothetical protein